MLGDNTYTFNRCQVCSGIYNANAMRPLTFTMIVVVVGRDVSERVGHDTYRKLHLIRTVSECHLARMLGVASRHGMYLDNDCHA